MYIVKMPLKPRTSTATRTSCAGLCIDFLSSRNQHHLGNQNKVTRASWPKNALHLLAVWFASWAQASNQQTTSIRTTVCYWALGTFDSTSARKTLPKPQLLVTYFFLNDFLQMSDMPAAPFEHRGSTILWYLPKRKLWVSVVFRSQWEKPLKPPLVVKFLCPLTPDATNQSTSHPEDEHIGLFTECVYLNVLDCGRWGWRGGGLCEHRHICFSACDPVWLLGGPSAWGTWHIAFPAEEGAGAAVRKHSGEERDLLSAKGQTWLAVFSEKPPHAPEGDNNLPNPVWLRSLPSKSPNPNH